MHPLMDVRATITYHPTVPNIPYNRPDTAQRISTDFRRFVQRIAYNSAQANRMAAEHDGQQQTTRALGRMRFCGQCYWPWHHAADVAEVVVSICRRQSYRTKGRWCRCRIRNILWRGRAERAA